MKMRKFLACGLVAASTGFGSVGCQSFSNSVESMVAGRPEEQPETKIDQNAIKVAEKLEYQKDFAGAKTAYLELHQKDPGNPKFCHRLAVLSVQTNDMAQAREYFAKAVQLAPSDPAILTDLGVALYKQKAFGPAEQAFRQAIASDPQGKRPKNHLALVLLEQGRTDEGLAVFKQLIPPARAHAMVGIHLARKGEIDGARTHLTTAEKLVTDPKMKSEIARQLAALPGAKPEATQIAKQPSTPEQNPFARVSETKVVEQAAPMPEEFAANDVPPSEVPPFGQTFPAGPVATPTVDTNGHPLGDATASATDSQEFPWATDDADTNDFGPISAATPSEQPFPEGNPFAESTPTTAENPFAANPAVPPVSEAAPSPNENAFASAAPSPSADDDIFDPDQAIDPFLDEPAADPSSGAEWDASVVTISDGGPAPSATVNNHTFEEQPEPTPVVSVSRTEGGAAPGQTASWKRDLDILPYDPQPETDPAQQFGPNGEQTPQDVRFPVEGSAWQPVLERMSRADVPSGWKNVCPVTLREQRLIVPAKAAFSTSHGGKTYFFSTQEALAKFEQAPERYTATEQGRDIVAMKTGQREIEGTIDHARWFENKLYFFNSAENVRTFMQDPSRFVTK